LNPPISESEHSLTTTQTITTTSERATTATAASVRPDFSPTASISPEAVEDSPLTEDEELQNKKSDSDGDVPKAVTAVKVEETGDETADVTAEETTSISRPGLRTFAIQPSNIMGKCTCTVLSFLKEHYVLPNWQYTKIGAATVYIHGGFCNNCTPKRCLPISVHFQTNAL
jgi:hypothetical protein